MFPNGIKHYFETELLDYALTIGMTEDEYWFGDPRLMDNFEKKESVLFKKMDLAFVYLFIFFVI